MKLKDKDEQSYLLKKDIESQKYNQYQMKDNNVELLNEKEALEKHAQVLQM